MSPAVQLRLSNLKSLWQAVGLALASILAYKLGLITCGHSGRNISLIYPVLGLGYGAAVAIGPRALLWIWLGGAVCLGFNQVAWPLALLIPWVDACECLAAWWLLRRVVKIEPTVGVQQAIVGFFLIPLFTGMLAAPVALGLAVLSGGPMPAGLVTDWAVVASSRVAGMIAVAPFVFHFLRGDFWRVSSWWSAGSAAILQAVLLCVTTAGFVSGELPALPPGAAIYMPFVILLLLGLFCPPPQAALGLLFLAGTSTFMTALGYGPLVATPSVPSLFLLGVYHAGIGGTGYLFSVGTIAIQDQARMLRLMTGTGRLVSWRWSSEAGLELQPNRNMPSSIVPGNNGNSRPIAQLAWLGWNGRNGRKVGAHRDVNWVSLVEASGPRGPLLMECQGLVVLQDSIGRPLVATGLLHDLSEARRFRATQIELAYQQERLRGLQAQLNPHFLFNSLNTVRALIGSEPETARQAVTALSSILRATLQFEARTKVPLREELKIVRNFLRIQHLRHGERLRSRLRLTRAASLSQVPPLLVLNLAENAILHGIEKYRSGGMVTVVCEMEGRFLHVRVTNPGQLVDGEHVGVGTENTRQRLAILYGPEASFSLTAPSPDLVVAHTIIPVLSQS